MQIILKQTADGVQTRFKVSGGAFVSGTVPAYPAYTVVQVVPGVVEAQSAGVPQVLPAGTTLSLTVSIPDAPQEADAVAINGELTRIDGDLTTVEGAVSLLQSEKTRIDGELTTAEGAISQLQSDATRIDGELTTAEGAVSQLQANVLQLQADLAAIDPAAGADGSNR